ncbi:polysaccharide biosynthesis protein [Sphingomonas oleivorans]|uniref:Polysaccharide biosynthesis protein n=1 Tax=Sphingomonas oleivorans TaxID=1735121 RepID=A0A2T5G202_9SPHN|nr:polysaccharide biosynthesis/export family protein [Sphingomonas oleivorans]PTQ13150.1 polysaccharide biosynthesis protein [Sphingomonas oleivorans]
MRNVSGFGWLGVSLLLLTPVSSAVLAAQPATTASDTPAIVSNTPPASETPNLAATTSSDVDVNAYRLGAGDKVRVTVYNEDTLSGEYEVDGSGNLAMQLIGALPAVDRTIPEITRAIEDKLKDGYMRNPSVAVEVLNYRPFYVLGEVKEPGKYPYVSGMTVLNAVALAGGYTYRGRKDRVMIVRAADQDKKEQRAAPTETVMPGDIIRIPERFF